MVERDGSYMSRGKEAGIVTDKQKKKNKKKRKRLTRQIPLIILAALPGRRVDVGLPDVGAEVLIRVAFALDGELVHVGEVDFGLGVAYWGGHFG